MLVESTPVYVPHVDLGMDGSMSTHNECTNKDTTCSDFVLYMKKMKNISPFFQTSGESGFERNCDFSFLDFGRHHHLCLWWQRRGHPEE